MEAASPLLGLGRDLNLWNSSCVNNCSGHGECSNGVCVCEVSSRQRLVDSSPSTFASNLISMSSVFIYLNLSRNCTHTLWEPLLYIIRGTWQQHFNQSDMFPIEVQQKYLLYKHFTCVHYSAQFVPLLNLPILDLLQHSLYSVLPLLQIARHFFQIFAPMPLVIIL